jgi:predicted esterase
MRAVLILLLTCTWLFHAAGAATAPTGRDPAENGPVWFKDEAGKDVIQYQVRAPAKPQPGRLGLIICFHGRTGDSGSLLGNTVAALDKAMMRDGYVVIGLKSKDIGWEDADDAPVTAFIDWALKHWPSDPRRVYGIGYSSGAFYLNRYAPNHSDLFAGAITWVGGQFGLKPDAHPETAADLYWISGMLDKTVSAEQWRPSMLDFVKRGHHCIYRLMRDYGHDTGREPCQEDAFRFLRALRNRRLPLGAEDQAFIDQFTDADKAKRVLGSAPSWARVVQIGGPQAAPAVLAGLASDKDGPRGNAATACTTTMFDGRVVAALVPLLDAKGPALRELGVTALTAQAEWDQPGAQAALCDFLAEAKRPAAERRAVAAGLGKVVRIDLQGSFRFARAIWTLVDALDDEDVGVRALALGALEPAKAEAMNFGYKPEAAKAGRAAAVEKWRGWCQGVCGAKPEVVAPVQ